MSFFSSDRERNLWLWVLVVLAWIYATLGPAYTLAAELRERQPATDHLRPHPAAIGGDHRLAVAEAAPWPGRDSCGDWHHDHLPVGDRQGGISGGAYPSDRIQPGGHPHLPGAGRTPTQWPQGTVSSHPRLCGNGAVGLAR